jgi:hypothetical protein
MPITTIKANTILDYYFGGQTGATGSVVPDPMYFGLSTTLVGATGWASVTEPNTGAYSRVAYANTAPANWAVAQTGVTYNTSAVTFPKSTYTWGGTGTPSLSLFITDVGPTGAGNVIWYMTLDPPMAIDTNTTVTFQTGCINVQWT